MSTRVFVRGLPPTFTEAEFRSHFAKRNDVTDARLIAHRRIGYIGFKTPEDAQAAVRYFDRTYIRMSKIGVEIAKSVAESHKIHSKNRSSLQGDTRKRQKLSPAAASAPIENKLKRKLDDSTVDKVDAPPNKKLQEFLDVMNPSAKSNTWSNVDHTGTIPTVESNANDDEYVDSICLAKVSQPQPPPTPRAEIAIIAEDKQDIGSQTLIEDTVGSVSDADWLRSRTSRLLDLTDDVPSLLTTSDSPSSQAALATASHSAHFAKEDIPGATTVEIGTLDHSKPPQVDDAVETILQSGRLFVRNLPYSAAEDDLRQLFSAYGELQEVHLPIDTKSQTSKGFVYVLYKTPSDAVEAYNELDRKEFQGRLLHIIPAAPKRENKLDEYAISKLPLKKQRELKRKATAATNQFNWNSMYMNADAVISSVAHKLGVSKADLLDPTSSDGAVKQAHAETHVIQETKAYFQSNGIDLKAFENRERDDKVVLLKNFPFGTKPNELRKLLGEFGELRQLLMPPTGTIAIAEFTTAPSARAAFTGLAYRRFKDGILFLEKGPQGLFTGSTTASTASVTPGIDAKISTSDLKDSSAVEQGNQEATTLFVRNLSFNTTADGFILAFQPLQGFLWARLKTKSDPKKPDQTLSMGFGFVGFEKLEQARAAIAAMNGYSLDNHKLLVKIAHKGADAASKAKAADTKNAAAMKGTKVIIKNLPFEVTKHDIRSLFGKYGTLRTVRMPKKLGNKTRGFAFAEFVTTRDAANAMDALKDTHLLGRRLVLDYAQHDSEDAEEEIDRMTKKASKQTGLVTLARLKENSKSKILLDESGAVDDMNDL
ncbi:RNA-binding domain-containing protein [Wilcoxina mikolae CBS 423.85]|nr:RNA-binding domain-containing protein [Wilcoxina mikolae CBS 423.85]